MQCRWDEILLCIKIHSWGSEDGSAYKLPALPAWQCESGFPELTWRLAMVIHICSPGTGDGGNPGRWIPRVSWAASLLTLGRSSYNGRWTHKWSSENRGRQPHRPDLHAHTHAHMHACTCTYMHALPYSSPLCFQYILTALSPSSTPRSPSSPTSPPPRICSSSVSPQRRASLLKLSTEHNITRHNETRHKASYQSWTRQPTRK